MLYQVISILGNFLSLGVNESQNKNNQSLINNL